MHTFRFGILGAGNIANYFCSGVRLVEGAEVLAVASKSPDRAAAFAGKNGIPMPAVLTMRCWQGMTSMPSISPPPTISTWS